MSLFEHLDELRRRLIWSVLAFMAGSVAGWFLYERVLSVLIRPLMLLPEADRILTEGRLVFTAPTEAFFIRLKVTAFTGFLIALPVILWHLWRFVTPGLYENERRYALPFIGASLALFACGVWFAFATLPRAVEVLAGFAPADVLVLLPRAADYLSFVLFLVLAFGIAFEMPVVLLGLTIAGVMSSSTLRRGRRIAWISILLVAAVITPTQDPITMMLMAIPLGLLYEGTIWIARLAKR